MAISPLNRRYCFSSGRSIARLQTVSDHRPRSVFVLQEYSSRMIVGHVIPSGSSASMLQNPRHPKR